MNITTSIRLRALLSIYRAQRKRRHCCLSSRLLEQEWRHTGLRRSDLQQALDDGLRSHWLERTAAGDYELTYLGEVAARSSMRGAPLRLLQEWMVLQRARQRRRYPAAVGYYFRRRGDVPPDGIVT